MSRHLSTTQAKLRALQKNLGAFAEAAEALSLSLGLLLEEFECPQDKETGRHTPSPVEALAQSYATELSREEPRKPDILEKLTGSPPRKKHSEAPNPDDNALGPTDLKILSALVQLGGFAPWQLLSVFTGLLHKTGNVGMSLARMRRAALLEGTSSEFRVTDAGRHVLQSVGSHPPELPRGYKLFEFWCNKLGPTEAKILKAIRAGETTVLGMGFTHKTGTTGMALAKLKRVKFITGSDGSFRFTDTFRAACDPTVRVFDGKTGAQHLVDARGSVRK